MTTVSYNGRKYDLPSRDSQRSKLYAAEQAAFGQLVDPVGSQTVEEVQAYVDRVVGSKTWERLSRRLGWRPVQPVRFESFPGGRGAEAYPKLGIVRAVERARKRWIILHELAHVLVGPGVNHHWPFARTYADLVAVFMGSGYRDRLEAEFKARRVRHRAPRYVSPEERAALAERGRKALGLGEGES